MTSWLSSPIQVGVIRWTLIRLDVLPDVFRLVSFNYIYTTLKKHAKQDKLCYKNNNFSFLSLIHGYRLKDFLCLYLTDPQCNMIFVVLEIIMIEPHKRMTSFVFFHNVYIYIYIYIYILYIYNFLLFLNVY